VSKQGAVPECSTESFELEGSLKGHLVQLPGNEQGHLQLHQVLRAPSSLTLSVSKGWDTTTSLGNPFQYLTTFIVKSYFLISNLNLPSFSLKPFLITTDPVKESVPCFLIVPI